jgi:1-acyl-sn-glycerol-3-phosphate acyltransferase
LAIAPEGTRKKVNELKTGFYYIALKSNVPIVPVAFDYGNKVVRIEEPFLPSGNIETDLPVLLNHFEGIIGKIPEYSFNPEK